MDGKIQIGTSGWHYKHWLGKFYPELADSVLICATEMSTKTDMDSLAAVTAGDVAAGVPAAEVLA